MVKSPIHLVAVHWESPLGQVLCLFLAYNGEQEFGIDPILRELNSFSMKATK